MYCAVSVCCVVGCCVRTCISACSTICSPTSSLFLLLAACFAATAFASSSPCPITSCSMLIFIISSIFSCPSFTIASFVLRGWISLEPIVNLVQSGSLILSKFPTKPSSEEGGSPHSSPGKIHSGPSSIDLIMYSLPPSWCGSTLSASVLLPVFICCNSIGLRSYLT